MMHNPGPLHSKRYFSSIKSDLGFGKARRAYTEHLGSWHVLGLMSYQSVEVWRIHVSQLGFSNIQNCHLSYNVVSRFLNTVVIKVAKCILDIVSYKAIMMLRRDAQLTTT